MKRIILTICLCMLLVTPSYAATKEHSPAKQVPTLLDISAEASIKASPDIATISTGVVTIDPKADQALKKNTLKMNNLFKALKAAGIADKDIQTSGFNLSPQYEYRPNKAAVISSYRAANNVTIIIHDLKNIGPVIDSLVTEGSNQINGPEFSIENADAVLDKVRQEAVAKALKRAQLYADAVSLKIKRIVSISEQAGPAPGPHPVMMTESMAAAAAPTPVAPGEVSLSVTVNMQFELSK